MKGSKILMILSAFLLASLFFFPIWKITLLAPQYPEPLGLNIHINKLSDGVSFNDVNNIDLLNHYIGMAHLPSKHNINKKEVKPLKEFIIFPIVVGVMSIVGLFFGFIGKPNLYLTWLVVMSLLAVAGLFDFYRWLYIYGHNLDLNAILKITDPLTGEPMGYQPPFIGYKKILNFEVYSLPAIGSYLMGSSMILSLLAFIRSKKEKAPVKASILSKPFLNIYNIKLHR